MMPSSRQLPHILLTALAPIAWGTTYVVMSLVVATLLGYIFLQQTLTPIQGLGVVIVLGSVLLGQQT